MKRCSRCAETKPFEAFSRKADAADGYHPHCKACDSERRKQLRLTKLDYERSADRARYQVRRDSKRAYDREYYVKNADKIKQSVREYIKENRDKMRPKNAQRAVRRYAAKIKATPAWADVEAIKLIYEKAHAARSLIGESYDVDHIVPLKGTRVCGLHVEYNLQIIPTNSNRSKGNRSWPETF